MQRLAAFVSCLFAVACLMQGVGVADPTSTAAIQGHRFTAQELADLSKEQLIEEVLAMQEQGRQVVALNELVAQTPQSPSANINQRKGLSKYFLPFAAVAGGIAVASLMSHRSGSNVNAGSSYADAFKRRGLSFNRMPLVAATSTAAPTCNIDAQFSCGLYPTHENTCTALSTLTTAEGTFTPLLAGKDQSAPTVEVSPAPGGPKNTTLISPPSSNDTKYAANGSQKYSVTQFISSGLGLGLHLFQIFGNCANGKPAIAGA